MALSSISPNARVWLYLLNDRDKKERNSTSKNGSRLKPLAEEGPIDEGETCDAPEAEARLR